MKPDSTLTDLEDTTTIAKRAVQELQSTERELDELEIKFIAIERNVRTALANIDERLPTLYTALGTFRTLKTLAKTADQRVASDMVVELTSGYIDMLTGLRKELMKK